MRADQVVDPPVEGQSPRRWAPWPFLRACREQPVRLATISARADAQVPAVPDDVDDPRCEKASGVVVLPLHIDWSGDPRRYDLSDQRQRARVYEQVLREGNDDDIRYFIDVDVLQRLWTRLWRPRRVSAAWAGWFRRHRGVSLPC